MNDIDTIEHAQEESRQIQNEKQQLVFRRLETARLKKFDLNRAIFKLYFRSSQFFEHGGNTAPLPVSWTNMKNA